MMKVRSTCSYFKYSFLNHMMIAAQIICCVNAFHPHRHLSRPVSKMIHCDGAAVPASATLAYTTTINSASRKNGMQLHARSESKWDNLVDEDGDLDEERVGKSLYNKSVPRDMRYIPRIVGKQSQNFVAIREAGGKELTNDVYINEPNSETFWFVGKVARISDVTLEQAIAKQYPLIEQHGVNLRPIELYPKRGELDIWVAPGDTEIEVSYNRPDIVFTKMDRDVPGASDVKASMLGFQGEVYEGGIQMGFRTWRNLETGRAAKPEVQSPSAGNDDGDYTEKQYGAPSEEDLEKLQKYLKDSGKNINEVYEEQQQRYKEEGKP